ncbi:MAG: hypothetical protein HY530_04440 [Chloroflexi bacterium]|nr:hypothetical protein [Chloroflexota bacterium]
MIKAVILRIVVVIVGIALVLFGRGYFYYEGVYQPPPAEIPRYEHVTFPPPPLTAFSDVFEKTEGMVLVDQAHRNAFDQGELNVLILRLVSRGLTVEFLGPDDDLGEKLLGEKKKDKGDEETKKDTQGGEVQDEKKEAKLEKANAFVIVSPRSKFTKEERETIEKFVSNSGKLLLVDDPVRRGEINSLAIDFGLLFEPDYLYNMKENEINYRNIIVTEFKQNDVTRDVARIALYTAGSISSAEEGIAMVDQNTFSSLIETRQGLSPLALARKSKVLAVYDLTFMTEPYNGTFDNNRLVSNIADWLAKPGEKEEETAEGEQEAAKAG